MKPIHLVLSLLALLLSLVDARAQTTTNPYAPVDQRMQQMVDVRRLNGASIILIRDGAVMLERHYGNFDANTRIPIASASKWLSGSVIGAMVDRGLLRWDDTVGRYMPDAPADKRGITIRQLFAHTSGLSAGETTACLGERTTTTLDACARLILAAPLSYPPGSRFAYGGNSMQVAGRLAEIAGGKSFDALFREYLGTPLGMSATDFGFSATTPGVIDSPNPRVAGGVRTTLADYAAFVQMQVQNGVLRGRRVLSAATVREMQRDQTFGVPVLSSPRQSFGYGIGQWRDRIDASGLAVQLSSQGAFGYSPWIDRETGIAGVIAVQSVLGNVDGDVDAIWALTRQIALTQPSANRAETSVVDGVLSGPQDPGATRDLYARASSATEIFEAWSGDTQLLPDPRAWHARLVPDTQNLVFSARFRSVPAFTPRSEQISGVQFQYAIPPQAKGLVLRFHGSGGSASGSFSGAESLRYTEYLYAHGYGVAALDSSDRQNRQWNTVFSLNNPDVVNVQAALERLRSQGLIGASTPVFGQGTSNGGAFVSRVSALLGFRGQEVTIAAGIESVITQSGMPTLWALSRRDGTLAPGYLETAERSLAALRARGVHAEINVLEPSPVYPERFARIRALSVNDSRTIYTALKNAGALDGNDYLRVAPTATALAAVLPPGYAAQQGAILGQLELAWADHEFISDFMHRSVHFFDALLRPNYSDLWNDPAQPGWGVQIAHQGDVLFPVWYTFGRDGRPLWMIVSGAPRQPDGSYAGDVFRFTGTPFDRISGNAADPATRVGTARFTPDGQGRLRFDYTVEGIAQSRTLSRFSFGPPSICRFIEGSRASAPTRSDAWYWQPESGWGLSLIEQGNTLVLTWFTYAGDRQPMWLGGVLTRQADGSFRGSLNRPASGVPFNEITAAATALPLPTVGSASMRFLDAERGVFEYTLDGVTQSRPIQRFVYSGPGLSECM